MTADNTQGEINSEVLHYIRNQFAKLTYISKKITEICDRLETVETRIESLDLDCRVRRRLLVSEHAEL